jgi:hypothetical protein
MLSVVFNLLFMMNVVMLNVFVLRVVMLNVVVLRVVMLNVVAPKPGEFTAPTINHKIVCKWIKVSAVYFFGEKLEINGLLTHPISGRIFEIS